MAYIIDEKCTSCGECINECHISAIFEEEDKYFVDEERCIECGACEEVCPVQAIYAADK